MTLITLIIQLLNKPEIFSNSETNLKFLLL